MKTKKVQELAPQAYMVRPGVSFEVRIKLEGGQRVESLMGADEAVGVNVFGKKPVELGKFCSIFMYVVKIIVFEEKRFGFGGCGPLPFP